LELLELSLSLERSIQWRRTSAPVNKVTGDHAVSQELTIEITAIDENGASVSGTFKLSLNND